MLSLITGRPAPTDPDLKAARIEIPRVAGRADAKVKTAVELADRVFQGVERRRVPR